MEAERSATGTHPPLWKIWANPIVRRYARSRLRPRSLGVALLATLMFASFLFFIVRAGADHWDLSRSDLARTPLIPLLVLQGLILFVLATGQMAAGITGEADEGVIDYQRLAPMTPMAKVLGYLFGLPLREYILFLATMPFSIWSMVVGQVPLLIGLQLYGVFMVAAVLYHLTGLMSGTVVKNRRWAFLSSMGVVFLLYTVVPQAANMGLVYFRYVTIEPVFIECLPHLLPRDAGAVARTWDNFAPTAKFFDLDLPQAAFTVVTQVVLILAMVVMLWRRWYRAESHLMGKVGAVGLFAWIQIMLLGNALPLISSGEVFPSNNSSKWMKSMGRDWYPDAEETVGMTGAYGVVTLLILWLMVSFITPNRDRQIRGWRRARKLGQARLSPGSDPSTSTPWVFAMVVIGAGGWFWFSKEVVESTWFPGASLPSTALAAYVCALATAGFGFQFVLEGLGARAAGLCTLLAGIAPLLLGVIFMVSSDRMIPLGIWTAGISPVVGPLYGSGAALHGSDLPPELARGIPRAFWFWQLVAFWLVVDLTFRLRKSRKEIAERSRGDGEQAAKK